MIKKFVLRRPAIRPSVPHPLPSIALAKEGHLISYDPNAEFDHAALDKIDLSATGALPATPAYQDALKRLYAAQQVYAHADHKGGHFTARSLARLPFFHARNLDAFIAGQITDDSLETNASI